MIKSWLQQARASHAANSATPRAPWGVSHDDNSQKIAQGMGIIANYLAVPGLGKIGHVEPLRGVRIIDREEEFEIYILAVLALLVNEAKWSTPKFYYNAKLGPQLIYSNPWRQLERGAGQHMRPKLDRSHDVFCFHHEYYWFCQIILEVVVPPEMQGGSMPIDFHGGGNGHSL